MSGGLGGLFVAESYVMCHRGVETFRKGLEKKTF